MEEEQMIMGKDYIITNRINNLFRYKGCLKEIAHDLYKFENDVEFYYNENLIKKTPSMTFSSAKYTFKLDNIDEDDDTDDDYIMDGIYYKKKMKKLYYRRKSIRIKKKSLKKKSSRRKLVFK